ncbi:hypothetical protein B0A55_08818 [Friedmanniomyces simplex]|uniref:Carbonic anhydrase n=1 Tax=Friedmanniomyces simplex TaxID=329884 RepID=A0A4U0WVM0_9PEZI|nr:hypothetical protein B0A55_08818 [Friedmanniomyces simplex]
MSAADIRALAKNNESYEAQHPNNIRFDQFPNAKAMIILTCMDPRSNPYEFWKVEFGPAIIRNAGGRATEDALRSMRVLSSIMANGENTLGAVAVVHHTDCGLHHGLNFGNEFIRKKLAERVPELAGEVEKMDFGSFADVEASVKEDMAVVKNDPYLPKDLEVLGYVHDSFTGKTREVFQSE